MPRDDRTFITVHDGMPEHPKVEGLSDGAFRLMVEAWCWCARNHTDGLIREPSWRKRGTPRTRAELLAAGLVDLDPEGVRVHDYTEHQRTAAEIEARKQKAREAGSKGGKARAEAQALAKQTLEQTGSETQADTETERTRNTSSSSRTKRGTRLPDDWKPPRTEVEWRRENGISDLVAQRELPKFNDYWHARAGREATKVDWLATWRNWLRNAQEREPQQRTANLAAERVARRKGDPLGSAR